MRHHTKDLLLKSPLDREHEMITKINLAETPAQINDLRLLIWMDDFDNRGHLLAQIKRRENFLKD